MKTKYYCEYCDKEFSEEQQCRLHEQDCAVVPDWVAPGRYIVAAAHEGETWKIEEYVASERAVVLAQIPMNIANGSSPSRILRSVAQVVNSYEPATVTPYDRETIPTGKSVYIPGEFVIGTLEDDYVVLTASADKEASLKVPLDRFHRLCAHAGTEVPAAKVTIHDDHEGEDYDLIELVDSYGF